MDSVVTPTVTVRASLALVRVVKVFAYPSATIQILRTIAVSVRFVMAALAAHRIAVTCTMVKIQSMNVVRSILVVPRRIASGPWACPKAQTHVTSTEHVMVPQRVVIGITAQLV